MQMNDTGNHQEMVDMKDAIINRICDLCEVHGFTIYELAKRSGVSQSTLNEIMQGRSENPRIHTLKKVAYGFGMKLQEFFDHPIFDHIKGVDDRN